MLHNVKKNNKKVVLLLTVMLSPPNSQNFNSIVEPFNLQTNY